MERPTLERLALVRAHLHAGRVDAALETARHSSIIDDAPVLGEALREFAAARASGAHATLLRERAERHPDDYDAALALASALHGQGRLGDALVWAKRAHALRPLERLPREIEATALVDRGNVEQGLAQFRELLPDADAATAARYLVLMHYDPVATNDELFARLHAFAQTHVPRFGMPFTRSTERDTRRRLRIGWLSPRFAEGPVASFLASMLAAFDRTHHRHLLISLQTSRDEATARFETLADEWIVLAGLDDATLLQRLRALELDVLVDLAGHSTANRIGVVAQRVAPVQVSWLDWFDTTAIPAIDAWISDAWLTPEDSTQRYTERLLRLASGRFCYSPPNDAPSASYAGDGAVVFASFNRLAKFNAEVVAAWASILRRVPGSRLELGTRLLGDEATRAYTRERFAAHGIEADRLGLHGNRTYPELLAAYRSVDIALDPFPFSGCTTTCDALYMGAAVIARTGETFVSRQSASLLERLGRGEWGARDADDYIERAVAAAAEVDSLRAARETQRREVVARLCDSAAQARDFAAALGELVG
jgi:predicted O-linked N-acetylglucosamine transferase (SPINDLY family)